MKLSTMLLVAGLLCSSLVLGAEQTEPAADQAAPAQAQPPMTQKEIDAATLEAAKKEFEAGQQRAAAGADGVDYQPWTPAAATPKAAAPHAGSQFHPASVPGSAAQTYASQWGIDTLRVAYTSSGNLLRFSYRVVDTRLAAPLADKKFTPSLYSPKHHAVLSVPVMEKVGPLRQSMGQEAGKEYWMAFSNRGQLVKSGERVNVTIGSFHADGLLVE